MYMEKMVTKTKILNIIPFYFSKKIFNFISAFYPTVNINKLSNFLNSDFEKYEKKIFIYMIKKQKRYLYFFTQLFNILFSVNVFYIWMVIYFNLFFNFFRT